MTGLLLRVDFKIPALHYRSYGMVSVEEKMDRRTVEDIQAEIREKRKRQKVEGEQEEGLGDNEEEEGDS